jgi:2-polyprenyl-3-methyl-5-hydroxy-6-metoxy-1,4-benzoquinol methylase
VSVDERVRRHFDLDAVRFDAIYEDRKSPLGRFVDDVWRGVVRRRFELTLRRLDPLAGKSVLDVGCGSGRYCLAYAERGAARVAGIDFAPEMVALAAAHAARLGLSDRCEFVVGAYPDACPSGRFDASTAMGFFDYVSDPIPIIRHMRSITSGTMVMSFPKSREWRVPIRKLRFRLRGCPLFLYSASRVAEILGATGVRDHEVISLDRDYIVVARV